MEFMSSVAANKRRAGGTGEREREREGGGRETDKEID